MASPSTDIAAFLERVRDAWPDLLQPEPGLVEFARPRAKELGGFTAVHPDVALAFGCLQGHPEALATLEERLFPRLVLALRKLGLPNLLTQDAMQDVRQALLMGVSGPPKLNRYRGRGPIEPWLRVVAVRRARVLALRQGERPKTVPLEALERAVGDHPELAHLRRRLGPAFREAVERGVAELPDEQRLLLKLAAVDALGIDGIARLLDVHRATAARRLAAARQTFVGTVRAQLASALGLSTADVDSLLRSLRGSLEVSLGRLLAGG